MSTFTPETIRKTNYGVLRRRRADRPSALKLAAKRECNRCTGTHGHTRVSLQTQSRACTRVDEHTFGFGACMTGLRSFKGPRLNLTWLNIIILRGACT